MAKIPSTPKESKFPKVEYSRIPDGEYEARLVRFVGLGVQEQRPYKDQKKDPAFTCHLTFELIDQDVKGVDSEGKEITKPACVFDRYVMYPKASRGKIFDLCNIIEAGTDSVPEDLEWFGERLGAVCNITVGHYTNRDGKDVSTIRSIDPIPAKYRAGVGDARTEMVFFDPYEDNEVAFAAYSKLWSYQRDDLVKAIDSKNIPYAGKEPAKTSEQTGATDERPSKPVAPKAPAAEDDDAPF